MNTLTHQNIEPSLSSSFSYGWEIMKDYFLTFLLLLLVLWLVSVPLWLTEMAVAYHSAGAILVKVLGVGYMFLVYPVFDFASKYLFLQGVRRERVDIKNIIPATIWISAAFATIYQTVLNKKEAENQEILSADTPQ